MDEHEAKLNERLEQRLNQIVTNQTNMQKELRETKDEFQSKVNNLQTEVLWRIKDAEELIKERCSNQRVNSLLTELENRVK